MRYSNEQTTSPMENDADKMLFDFKGNVQPLGGFDREELFETVAEHNMFQPCFDADRLSSIFDCFTEENKNTLKTNLTIIVVFTIVAGIYLHNVISDVYKRCMFRIFNCCGCSKRFECCRNPWMYEHEPHACGHHQYGEHIEIINAPKKTIFFEKTQINVDPESPKRVNIISFDENEDVERITSRPIIQETIYEEVEPSGCTEPFKTSLTVPTKIKQLKTPEIEKTESPCDVKLVITPANTQTFASEIIGTRSFALSSSFAISTSEVDSFLDASSSPITTYS